MGKGRRRAGPRVKYVQPGYRHRAPAAPAGPAERIGRLSPSRVLERISRARLQREELDAGLGLLVDHAVSLGIGWPQIAARPGVSRQAARQHCQRRHRGGARLGGDHGLTRGQPAGAKHQAGLRQRVLPGVPAAYRRRHEVR